MASVLPDVIDRLKDLMEGSVSGLSRSISSGRFQHVPFDPGSLLARAVSAPYPFEIEDQGEYQPLDVPSTTSADQIWHGCRWVVRVAYASSPLDQTERLKTLQRDRYEIRRCLGDPLNWLTVTGIARVVADESVLREAEIIGADADAVDQLLFLETTLDLTYREDQS